MYKNFNLTESEREQILSMHQAHGYKKPLNEEVTFAGQTSSVKKTVPPYWRAVSAYLRNNPMMGFKFADFIEGIPTKGIEMKNDKGQSIFVEVDGFFDLCNSNGRGVHKSGTWRWDGSKVIMTMDTPRPLNESNQQAMAILIQETQKFNQEVDEDLTPDEYKEVMCSDPNEIIMAQNLGDVENQKAEEFKMAASKATREQLKVAKQQIKALKKQQQNEQVAAPALVTILGVSMNPGVAIAVGVDFSLSHPTTNARSRPSPKKAFFIFFFF